MHSASQVLVELVLTVHHHQILQQYKNQLIIIHQFNYSEHLLVVILLQLIGQLIRAIKPKLIIEVVVEMKVFNSIQVALDLLTYVRLSQQMVVQVLVLTHLLLVIWQQVILKIHHSFMLKEPLRLVVTLEENIIYLEDLKQVVMLIVLVR